MKKIRRIDAIALHLTKYFTAKTCTSGHLSERYTTNGHCVACCSELAKTPLVAARLSAYRNANKEIQKKRYLIWYAKNKDKKLSYMCLYNADIGVERLNKKYKEDHIFSVAARARARLVKAIQRFGYAKNGTTQELLGCSYEELTQHLEAKFISGMNWSNRAEWHIDHIVPIASAKTEPELLALFHFSNLQPLWAADNRRKGARLEVPAC